MKIWSQRLILGLMCLVFANCACSLNASEINYSDDCLRQVGMFFQDIREEGMALDIDVLVRVSPLEISEIIYAHMLGNEDRYTTENITQENVRTAYQDMYCIHDSDLEAELSWADALKGNNALFAYWDFESEEESEDEIEIESCFLDVARFALEDLLRGRSWTVQNFFEREPDPESRLNLLFIEAQSILIIYDFKVRRACQKILGELMPAA